MTILLDDSAQAVTEDAATGTNAEDEFGFSNAPAGDGMLETTLTEEPRRERRLSAMSFDPDNPEHFQASYWEASDSSGGLFLMSTLLLKDAYRKYDLVRYPGDDTRTQYYLSGAEPRGLRIAHERNLPDMSPAKAEGLDHPGYEEPNYWEFKERQAAFFVEPTTSEIEESRGLTDIALYSHVVYGLHVNATDTNYIERMAKRVEEKDVRSEDEIKSEREMRTGDNVLDFIRAGARLERDFLYLTEQQVRNFAALDTPVQLVREGSAQDAEAKYPRSGIDSDIAVKTISRVPAKKDTALKIGVYLSDPVIQNLQQRQRHAPDLITQAEQHGSFVAPNADFFTRLKQSRTAIVLATLGGMLISNALEWGQGLILDRSIEPGTPAAATRPVEPGMTLSADHPLPTATTESAADFAKNPTDTIES